jgi:hypothetical protein
VQLLDVRSNEAVRRLGSWRMRRLQGKEQSGAVILKPVEGLKGVERWRGYATEKDVESELWRRTVAPITGSTSAVPLA